MSTEPNTHGDGRVHPGVDQHRLDRQSGQPLPEEGVLDSLGVERPEEGDYGHDLDRISLPVWGAWS